MLATLLVAASLASAGAPTPEDVLYTAEGYAIGMRVSATYPADPAREHAALEVLNGLLHGPELATLHIAIETPAEVAADCGSEDALACYGGNLIVLPGEQVAGGPAVPYLLAHEYAHHILAHRRNDPWFASDWGAKRWATAMRVCPAVRRGELFLGYWSTPGEAFAESYARLLLPAFAPVWAYEQRLALDTRGGAAIRADVLQPWERPTVERSSGRLPRGGARAIRIVLPLDGNAAFRVKSSRPVGLTLLDGRRVVASARPRRRPSLAASICGQRRLTLRVTARLGATYSLAVSRP